MSKDPIIEITGSFGCWQIWIFAFLFYTTTIGSWGNMAITFLAPKVPFHCVNSTEQCLIIKENQSLPCTEWDYDTSYFPETIVSEWDLVCEREWLVSLAKSVYHVGSLFSVLIVGQIADWIGRFPVVVICYVIYMVSVLLSLFSTSYPIFIILRFFQAFGMSGLDCTSFFLLMEIIGAEHRTAVSLGNLLGFFLGTVLLPGVAYVFKHWVWFQLSLFVFSLPSAFSFWIIPESPRWLLMKRKMQKLEKVLEKAMKLNGKESKLTYHELDMLRNSQTEEKHASLLDLFKTPNLRTRIICMFFLWMANSFMYYGISYNTNELAGNPYITFLTSGLVEFPSYVILYWVLTCLGRRPTLFYLMIFGGVYFAATAVESPSMPWLETSLAMASKLCISASFNLLYIYTGELFPTVVRTAALGSSSMMARIGSISAPFVKQLRRETFPFLPDLLYGLLAISSGLAFLFPETKGKQMPDTLEEAEQYEFEEEEIFLMSSQEKPKN